MRLKKLFPILILLAIISFASYMLYIREGFFTAPTMTCSCPSGYTAADSSKSSKCYKCLSGRLSGTTCSGGGILDVKYKLCTCSNGKSVKCSDGKWADNNKCYNCDPSTPTYIKPTIMTVSTYAGSVRCTTGGSPTAASKTAYEVSNGLFCPT